MKGRNQDWWKLEYMPESVQLLEWEPRKRGGMESLEKVEGTSFTASATLFLPLITLHQRFLLSFWQESCSALIVRVAPFIPVFHPATHTHPLRPYVGTKKRYRRKLVPQWVHSKWSIQGDISPRIEFLCSTPLIPSRRHVVGPYDTSWNKATRNRILVLNLQH